MENRPDKIRVSDAVFIALRRAIVSGEYRPGDKLPSEHALCERFGVSRVSVRAALARLASLGLVQSRQGRGTFVCSPTGSEPLDTMVPFVALSRLDRVNISEFRRIVEVESAYLAADRADAAMVRRMYEATEMMERAETISEIASWDLEFHRLIAEATRNDIIIKVFEVLRGTYLALLENNVMSLGAAGAAYHRRIAGAIEVRSPVEARAAMLGHLNNTILQMQDLPGGRV